MGRRALPRATSQVTCVLPGLVWPAPGISAALQDLALPGLAAILGRGRHQHRAAEPYTAWLARQFGATDLPWGALRRAGERSVPAHEPTLGADEAILCADPVALTFASDVMLLRGPRELALQPAEVSALIAALNAEFGALGEFHAAGPERWYLRTRQPAARFHPLADVLGRPVAWFPPAGAQARAWGRIANEIQVLLHNHPVNQARRERGQLPANALWFWGQGGGASTTLQAPAAHIVSADPLLAGLAEACAVHALSPAVAGNPACGARGHTWWHDARLLEAALVGDFAAWRAALQQLDAELLQPLWQAWQSGRLHELALQAPSDKVFLATRLKRRTRWAFWRKPLANARLMPLLQAPADKPPAQP